MQLKLFGRDILIRKRLYGSGRDDELYFSLMAQRYGTDYRGADKLEAYRNLVHACISLIAEACGDYLPEFKRQRGTDLVDVPDHELLKLLRNPHGNSDYPDGLSMYELFEATASFMELQGMCYWYLPYGQFSRKPKEIILLRADKVGYDVDDQGNITGYFIRRTMGPPIPLELKEVLPFKYFNPKDPYKGMGRVEAASDYIATDEATAKFTKNFFANNAGLSGILNIKGDVTKNAFKKFVRQWRQQYQGVDNAGKVAIVRNSDAAFEKVGLGLNELDMAALRKMTMDDVLVMFRVPSPLLGKADQTGLGRGNVEALEYIFSKYNIDKKLQRFDKVLEFALKRYWGDDSIIVTHQSIIPQDTSQRLSERNLGVDRWISRNEIRKEDGFEAVEGGDELFTKFTDAPISEVAAGTNNTPAASTAAAASANQGKGIIVRRRVITREAKGYDLTQKEAFRLRLQRNQTRYERQYRKTLRPILLEQRKEALNNLEAHAGDAGQLTTKALQQKLFDDAAYDKDMLDQLVPTLRDLVEEQGSLALIFAGDEDNQFKVVANIEAFIRDNTKRMASAFNDETLERLNRTLTEGITNGEGLGDLKNRVSDVYDQIDSYRAERLARTETLKASNDATNWAYKQTGYVKEKQWYVNPDACPQCEEFDGKIIGLDDSFVNQGSSYTYTDDTGDEQSVSNDYDDIDNPPLHPNCRCTIIPVR